jgi:hypothetical protein
MSSAASPLPPGFEQLAPFVDSWSLAGAAHRAQRRLESSEAERAAFYHAAKDTLPAAFALLDQKPLAQFDAQETRLMNLLLSFAHVALAVEVQGDHEAKHAQLRRHLRITRASADA